MDGAVERSGKPGPDKELAEGAGRSAPLSANGNFEAGPHLNKFDIALRELVSMCMDAGIHTAEMVPALERELAWCRNPYQNPEDNQP